MFNRPCQICAEKDRRIQDLKCQIEMLASMVLPKTDPLKIPLLQVEADAVLEGNEEALARRQQEIDVQDAVESERAALLSGTYE